MEESSCSADKTSLCFNGYALSDVVSHLENKEKDRYISKLQTLGIHDPYSVPAAVYTDLKSSESLPLLEYLDIFVYLSFSPSPYSREAMKAYKSTDAYNFFLSGWVHDCKVWRITAKDLFIISAKVR